jgi:hypothetical protein
LRPGGGQPDREDTMADPTTTTTSSFTPAEWAGDHYRPIGGSYDTLALAIAAVEAHFRNRHGSGGTIHVFKPETPETTAAVIEAGSDSDPLLVRAVYKVLAGPTTR